MTNAFAVASRELSDVVAAHRMAVPIVRQRVAAIVVLLLGLGWALVSLVGNPGGVFSQNELRHLSGVPFAPPQIQQRIPPAVPSNDLDQVIDDLENIFRGVQTTPAEPSPGATQ